MPVKSWRIDVDTTTRSALLARSDTKSRSQCRIPVAQPARHRENSRETPDTGGPSFGLGAKGSKTLPPTECASGSTSDGRGRVNYKIREPLADWDVLLKDYHEGYIDWAEYERNQVILARNAFGKAGGAKLGRGGNALFAGLLSCGRRGRRLHVVYAGRISCPAYRGRRTGPSLRRVWLGRHYAGRAAEPRSAGARRHADASNPFSAELNAALWVAKTVAEGRTGDLFYTMNKEASGDDLGLTLQTGFLTKALVGCSRRPESISMWTPLSEARAAATLAGCSPAFC